MKKKLLFGVILLTPLFASCGIEDDPINSGSSGSTGSTQCHAITQKGKRCKRMVADGGYYCWQHR